MTDFIGNADFDVWCAQNRLVSTQFNPGVFAVTDIETTGLGLDDVILELGLIVTDEWGQPLEGAVYHSVVYERTEEYAKALRGMPEFVRNMHSSSGLISQLPTIGKRPAIVEAEAIAFLSQFATPKQLHALGSSVHFDESRIERYMPNLFDFLHYRQLNVSSFKLAARYLNPPLELKMDDDDKQHRVIADCVDTIHEWQHYIDNLIFVPGNTLESSLTNG